MANGEASRLEHVEPCAVLLSEIRRPIELGVSDETVASMQARHGRVARITKAELQCLDHDFEIKATMSTGWSL
jgi:hypothetical protein